MAAQLDDLRVSCRLLAKHPGFTVLAVVVLGLGIGANTAVFSLVEGVLLRPLPYPEPEELVALWEVEGPRGELRALSPPTFRDWRQARTGLRGLAVYVDGRAVVSEGTEPREVRTARVSPGFFSTLGVPIPLGRSFDEDEAGQAVVILGHEFWMGTLGGEPEAVGGTIPLGGEDHRILGVAPAGFALPAGAELWLPLDPAFGAGIRGAHILSGIGRLAPGATSEVVQEQLSAVSATVEAYGGRWSARVVPLHRELVGAARDPLLILLGAVFVVLLVASANVANLILARTYDREEELAVRTAMGASRGRIFSLLLTEGVLVSLLAGGMGIVLATWSLDLLLAVVPGDVPRADGVSVNWVVLSFALGISLFTGVLAGLIPAFRASRGETVAVLREGSPGATAGRRKMRIRGGLVVAETALTVLLLAGAGLLARSFVTATQVDPGFQAANVLAFDLRLPTRRYPEADQWQRFFHGLREQLEGLPSVRSAALTRNPPMKGRNMTSPVRIEGRDTDEGDTSTYVQASTVSPGYFRTLGTEPLEGRTFSEADDGQAPPVAVVNQAFAETFFPGERAVGKRARTLFGEPVMREIVGVVEDVRHHALTRAAPPTFYVPQGQDPSPSHTVLVRTTGDPMEALSAIRGVVWRADPGLPLAELATMEELLSRTVAGPRFYMTVVGIFAFLAVTLAVAGLYGVMASTVARRRREMGIRFAVGARRPQVLGMVLREALLLSGLGVALGLGGALASTRILESLLFQVSPTDPLTLLGGGGIVLLMCALTAGVPAWRAARVDPARALRS